MPIDDFSVNYEKRIPAIPPIPLDTLSEQLPPKFLIPDMKEYTIEFLNKSQFFCVGIVDMVDSSTISSKLSLKMASKYYQIFLNTMARIVNRFGGMIIKNSGDSLLFYFPESTKGRRFGFMMCLECCLSMIDAHDFVNLCARNEKLPKINYRISCDYGEMAIISGNESHGYDMIGTPLNICSKINRMAGNNEFVVGGDLYEITKKLPEYSFQTQGNLDTKLQTNYSVYSVKRSSKLI